MDEAEPGVFPKNPAFGLNERRKIMAEQQSAFLLIKENLLVHQRDTIYYGSMGDDYVVMLNVQSHARGRPRPSG